MRDGRHIVAVAAAVAAVLFGLLALTVPISVATTPILVCLACAFASWRLWR